jgi:ADP-ribose pyrophosphatase YjhB (NUDIX family)
MYKVFVNDYPIILTETKDFVSDFKVSCYEDVAVYEIVNKMFNNNLNGIYLICNDLNASWNDFQSYFNIQKAAGGKVLNKNEDVLFIYRFNKWDLPKGKLEKNETTEQCAIREVEEECNVSGLKIIDKLPITYHIFKLRNQLVLKVTHWYLMSTPYNQNLIPQTEEGIKKVCFFNKKETHLALQNTYSNIKLLF